MNTLMLLIFIAAVMCWVAHNENENTSENRKIGKMVEADLKAERKRGDILSQRRRGNYR